MLIKSKFVALALIVFSCTSSYAGQCSPELPDNNNFILKANLAFDNYSPETEAKFSRLMRKERKLWDFPYEEDYIKEVFIPEVHAQRSVLAPHFPDLEAAKTDPNADRKVLICDWIDSYADEYQSYIFYLTDLIEQNFRN